MKGKVQTKKVVRKVQSRRWDKAIAPNHNNHNHGEVGSPIKWG
ncbi:MAG: hypothetical protein AAGF95_17870 [Chloroflexota bacterium]